MDNICSIWIISIMTPKKAITILLIIFVIMVISFIFLYSNKQSREIEKKLANPPALIEESEAARIKRQRTMSEIERKIDNIVEEAKKDPEQKTPAIVREEIVGTINTEVIKIEENKTPEQKAADERAQAERQRILDQINNEIRKKQ